MKKSLTIDLQHAALLLIDLQEEQRHDPLYAVDGIDEVLANAQRLLLAARKQPLPVFHAAYRRDFDLCPPRPFEPVAESGGPTFSDKANPRVAICQEVAPVAGELVVYKNDASAFCEDNLAPALNQREIEWLFIAGVWTEACVAATVRDAIAQGKRVILVKDACGSGTQMMHQTAVLNLANRLYGGAVTNTSSALALMAGGTVEVWMPERPVPILFHYADAADHYDRL